MWLKAKVVGDFVWSDRRGYGDDPTVLTAARAIGWHRLADDIAAEVRRRAEELQP